jgi:hypothetical protein
MTGSRTDKPRLGKAHSKMHADEYLRLGWTLKHEFFAEEAPEEPYEYIFSWDRDTDPISPSHDPKQWGASK